MDCLKLKLTLIFTVLLFTTGCGRPAGQPDLGTVTGIVKLDGKPLPKVNVMFGPVSGRPSVGVTNAEGKYELSYLDRTKGAKVGSHIVSITTWYLEEDSPEALNTPEKIPNIYNTKTTLKAEVKPGKNEINFDLNSKFTLFNYA